MTRQRLRSRASAGQVGPAGRPVGPAAPAGRRWVLAAGRWVALGAVLLAAAVGASLAPGVGPARAIPSGGPGADTPGTNSSVSPTTLSPCQTINFTVSGYPAGEIVYIKIDDGIGYGDTSVQGSGVWHSQAIPASGTVNGSFELPCDIAPGAHWLRFLASQYVDPADPGKGVLGFTRRGGADFTVVSAATPTSGGAGGGSGTGGSGSNASSGLGGAVPEAGATVGSGAEQVGGAGAVLAIDPDLIAEASSAPVAESSSASSAAASAAAVESSQAAAAAPAATVTANFPVVGVAGAAVMAGVGVLAAVSLMRRRALAAAGAASPGTDTPSPGMGGSESLGFGASGSAAPGASGTGGPGAGGASPNGPGAFGAGGGAGGGETASGNGRF
jgi:hypothetical protein